MSVISVKSVIMYVSKDLSLEEFEQVMEEIIHERKEAERNKVAAFEAGVSDTESVHSADLTNSSPNTTVTTNLLHWKREDSNDSGRTDAIDDSFHADGDSWESYLKYLGTDESVCSPIPNFNNLSIESDSHPLPGNSTISLSPILSDKADIFVDLAEVMGKHPELYSISMIDGDEDEVQNNFRSFVGNLVNSILHKECNQHLVYPGSWFVERADKYQLRIRRGERYPVSSLTTSPDSVPDELAGHIPTLEEFKARRLVPWRFAKSLLRLPETLSKEESEKKLNLFKKFTSEVNQGHCVVSKVPPPKPPSHLHDHVSGDSDQNHDHDRSNDNNGNQGDRHNGDARNKSSGSGNASSRSNKRSSHNGNASNKKQRQHALGVLGMKAEDELDEADDSEDDSENSDDAEQVAKAVTKTASGPVEPDTAPAQAKTKVAADSSVADDASHVEDATLPLKVDRQLFPASPLSDHRGPLRKEELKRKATVATDADETCTVAMTEPLVYKATKGHILDMDGHSVLTEPLDHDEDPDDDNDDDDGRANSGSKFSAPILVRDNKRQFSMRSEEERASLQKQGVVLSLEKSTSLLFAMVDQQRSPVRVDRQYILLRDFVLMMSGSSRSILMKKGATLVAQLQELLLGGAKLMAQATSFDSKERDALSERFSVALGFLRDVEALTGQDLAQCPLEGSVASLSVQTDEVYIPRGRNPLCYLLLNGNYVNVKPTSKSEPVALLAGRILSATTGKSVKTSK